jgi:hypothetical protein
MRPSGLRSTRKSAALSRRRPIRRSASCSGVDSTSRPRRQNYCEPSNEQMVALDPELDVAAAAMVAEGARFVVVGGFSVIANRFIRATEDVDFLVPDDTTNDQRVLAALVKLDGVRLRDEATLQEEHLLGRTHLRAKTRAGVIDIMRGGLPPLDYETVEERAIHVEDDGVRYLVAGLSSIVGFKRLAGRPRDRNDLIGLEGIYGELPIESIPGLDT